MEFNSSFKASLNERIGSRSSGNLNDVVVTYWSGTAPTKEQLDQAIPVGGAIHIESDDTEGRISTEALVTWFASMGISELASMYVGSTNYFQVLDDSTVIFDASTREDNFEVVQAGTIGFFTILGIPTAATSANWKTSTYEIQHLIMGSVGTEGSEADLIISELDITQTSTIKIGTVNINF